ncbi:class I SAM-dependent rRNA methyltransferase [Roseibacterium sp. SDUM158016]|uniref:RSP_2647 family RNA methyltransferase n=1 Tax=Roseicyclus sediminis TaxID=2980997 RepID=UPI0021D271BF|nr:class I SAM-dependent rRNA methyltransferase [Roseibacterium sp. SDUM158016]MCU4653798.1 class I SAM-dependent rRNA methyltransferase [Roseibacterium sp. SDUM158016]
MTPSPLPVLRLKPKADARRIRHGHPWAWSDDLVLDRRARGIAPGALAVLEDAGRVALGVGVATVEAKIGLRLLDRDPGALIDRDWLRARLSAALDLRSRAFDAPFYRLVHAEGDGLPGLIADRFGDTIVIQPNAIWLEERLDDLTGILAGLTGATCIVKNGTGRARAAEGLPEETTILVGKAPEAALDVPMNGAVYKADVTGGQKTGLFFDQRPNHAFAASMARGARVLDVFSHVGGFALACLAGGAASALAVDASEAALALARSGAEASGVADRFGTRAGDAFDTMTALAGERATFDLVICDPPAFAPSKQALTQGLRAYERTARLAADLVAPGGIVILCSCSHAADLSKFRMACLRGLGRAGRDPRLIHTGFAGPDHPQHPALTETGYLKALAFRLMP